jgi:putative transposase
MERLQAYKLKLRLNGEKTSQLWQFAGQSQFVYNKALALKKGNHQAGKKYISYPDLCKKLTLWRKDDDTLWLKLAPAQALQQSLKDLDRAYQNFFAKRSAFPRFKNKVQRYSFRFPDPKQFKLDQAASRLFLPKLGWIRYRNSRNVVGLLRNITVS